MARRKLKTSTKISTESVEVKRAHKVREPLRKHAVVLLDALVSAIDINDVVKLSLAFRVSRCSHHWLPSSLRYWYSTSSNIYLVMSLNVNLHHCVHVKMSILMVLPILLVHLMSQTWNFSPFVAPFSNMNSTFKSKA